MTPGPSDPGPGGAGPDARRDFPAQGARWFAECFGQEPEGVWFAPGRVNLIGEHTDYNEGFVLPFALGQGVVAAAAPRHDDVLALRTRRDPDAVVDVPLKLLRAAGASPGEIRDGMPGWARYPAGVAWSLLAAGHPVQGVNLAIDSCLADGAGLSSSAALECSVALALTELSGAVDVARPELARSTRRAENEFVGVPSGIMDQSASLLCRADHALLLDCQSLESSQVPFDPVAAGVRVLVIDTRAKHELAAGEYDNQRVQKMAVLLRSTHGDDVHALAEVGGLLTESHASLRDDFEVSWPEADVAVDVAVEAGALGARMTGGGFGGSAIALVPDTDTGQVESELRAAYADWGWNEPEFMNAVPSDAAQRVL
jgi:galactokinase